jgi:hypothetical protein
MPAPQAVRAAAIHIPMLRNKIASCQMLLVSLRPIVALGETRVVTQMRKTGPHCEKHYRCNIRVISPSRSLNRGSPVMVMAPR